LIPSFEDLVAPAATAEEDEEKEEEEEEEEEDNDDVEDDDKDDVFDREIDPCSESSDRRPNT